MSSSALYIAQRTVEGLRSGSFLRWVGAEPEPDNFKADLKLLFNLKFSPRHKERGVITLILLTIASEGEICLISKKLPFVLICKTNE